jgi:hypothetical protein
MFLVLCRVSFVTFSIQLVPPLLVLVGIFKNIQIVQMLILFHSKSAEGFVERKAVLFFTIEGEIKCAILELLNVDDLLSVCVENFNRIVSIFTTQSTRRPTAKCDFLDFVHSDFVVLFLVCHSCTSFVSC